MLTPPYYAVIFVSRRTPVDSEGYAAAAERMLALAQIMPGFLAIDSVRDPTTGQGITVSYWQDEASIANWRQHAEHRETQLTGIQRWYEYYDLHIARVERAYQSAKRLVTSTTGE